MIKDLINSLTLIVLRNTVLSLLDKNKENRMLFYLITMTWIKPEMSLLTSTVSK